MEIKDRQKVLVIAAIAVLALFLGDKIVFSPLMKSWNDRATRITDLRKQVAQGKALVQREQSIRGRWREMQQNALTNDTSAAEQQFFKALYNWEQDSRVTITSRAPQWKHDADDYLTYQCRVDATGNLNSLARFLYDIERDPIALKLDSVELSAHDKLGQVLTLGVQISALVLTPQAK